MLQLQQSSTKDLKLQASVNYTAAICIWQSTPDNLEEVVSDFWRAAAGIIAEQASWMTLQLDSLLLQYLKLELWAEVPTDLVLAQHDLTSANWTDVQPGTRTVLLIAHAFLKMIALQRSGKDDRACALQVCYHIRDQIRLFQTAPLPAPLSEASPYIACIRGIVFDVVGIAALS